jgi:ABC-type sugar transport system permease subunit
MASTSTRVRPATPSPRPGLHRRTDHTSADRRLGYGLLAPAMAVFLAITGFPLVYNLWNSLHEVDLADPSASEFVGVDNYTTLFTDPEFLVALARTTAYTVVSVAVQTAIALGVALVLHQRFRGRGFVRAAVLIPWAVPTVVSAMIWKNIFDPRTGFLNYVLGALHLPGADTTWLAGPWTAWLAIFAADAWKTVPFTAIILLAGLQVIPDDIYEAGRVDGANAWQRFLHLTLPMLVPALMVVLIFRTISAFLIFDVVFIMTGGGPGETTETITYLNWKAFLVDLDFGAGAAISIVLVVLALLISAVYVKTLRPRV